MIDPQRRAVRIEALIVVALLLLPLLFWWQLWLPANRAAIPEGDFTGQYYPLQLFAARELAAGRLPAWDPYLNAGQPGIGDIQTGFFYPPNLAANLILALAGRPYSLDVLTAQVIFHFMLAGAFTYAFVRRLARRAGARLPAARVAGAVAALSFVYAGYLTSFPVQQITILETAVWLPLVLYLLDRAAGAARPWPALVLAALALACALLAGHPQTAMYAVYATLAYGLFANRRPAGARLAFYAYPVVVIVLAALLAAVQLWPALEFIARSTRAALDYETVAPGLPLHEITHLLYPGYFGGSPQYVGILPPILAVAAYWVPPARRQAVFWTATAAVALLLAFGGNTFLYNVAYLLAPGFAAVRNQERILVLFSLAVAVLAGLGALVLVQPIPHALRKGYRRLAKGVAWALAAMAALTAVFYAGFVWSLQQQAAINLFEAVLRHHALLLIILAGAAVLFALRRAGRARAWRIGLALALIGLNLFTVNWRYNQVTPPEGGPYPAGGIVDFLRRQDGVFRVAGTGLLPGGDSAGAVYQIEGTTGNTPLRLAAFQTVEEQLGNWRQWQLLNVHYVIARRDLGDQGLDLAHEEGPVKVYRVRDPLPRAWVVHHTVPAADAEAPAMLNAGDFDPRTAAVIPAGGPLPVLPGGGGPGAAAAVVDRAPGRLVLDVAPDRAGVLIVSQPFFPGWRAWLDGERVPVARADYVLQAVPIEAGAHRVELRYGLSPWPAAVTLAALAACAVGLILARTRGKGARPGDRAGE